MILPSRRMTHFGFMDDCYKSYQFERCVWTSSSKVVSENESSWMIWRIKSFTQFNEIILTHPKCELRYAGSFRIQDKSRVQKAKIESKKKNRKRENIWILVIESVWSFPNLTEFKFNEAEYKKKTFPHKFLKRKNSKK